MKHAVVTATECQPCITDLTIMANREVRLKGVCARDERTISWSRP